MDHAGGEIGAKSITLAQWASRPEVTLDEVMEKDAAGRRVHFVLALGGAAVWSENLYAGFLARQEAEVARLRADEHTELPRAWISPTSPACGPKRSCAWPSSVRRRLGKRDGGRA